MYTATANAVIAAGTAVVVVALTNYFTKGREHEADWRKMKLERYREYILALSGVVEERATKEAHARYADAVNGLRLVAPPKVLEALERYPTHASYRNRDRTLESHDRYLSVLVRAMRQDFQPAYKGKDEHFIFHLQGVKPPPISSSCREH